MMENEVIRRETVTQIWEEAQPLFRAHFDEIAMYKDIPLSPHWAAYKDMEDRGILRIYAARVGWRLVGYFFAMVMPHLHYSRTKFAIEDVIFLLPEYRTGGLGGRLMAFGEKELVAEGAEVIVHHVKAAHPRMGEMLKRRGYELMDHIYTKRIT